MIPQPNKEVPSKRRRSGDFERGTPRCSTDGSSTSTFGPGSRGEFRSSDAAISKDTLNTLDIARRRVGVEGEVLKALAFKIDRELSSIDPWRDVYIDVTQLGEAQFRFGQFKMPFSLDENTGSLDLDFAYRSSAATLLAPSRARGWMVHGDTFDRAVGYDTASSPRTAATHWFAAARGA